MRSALRFLIVSGLTLAVGTGCPGDPPTGDTDTEAPTSGIPTTQTEGPSTATGSDSTAGTSVGEGSADSASSDGAVDTTEGTTTTGNDPTNPVDCGGNIYACGDGIDNDDDGYIDLIDPECTGPCDDDESSFQTGLPGDNMDCKQDCFFDGNSGQGDDHCIWDLKCDPENPGEFINCEYTGGMNCDNNPPNQTQDCKDYCTPYVPPGCDCFGCCTVQLPDGSSIDIFLNSSEDCALDNIEACTTCTSQIDDCGNTCEPVDCEICFGETEPPPGCGENTCPSGNSCNTDTALEDCPTDYFCYLGCCYPPPPG